MADDEQYSALEATLDRLGGFGRFQRRTFASATLIYFVAGLNNLGYIFWAERPDHWCEVPQPPQLSNLSLSQWKHLVIPTDRDGAFSHCTYRAFNWSILMQYDVLDNTNFSAVDGHVELRQCDSWKFDDTQYKNTIVTDVSLHKLLVRLWFCTFMRLSSACR